MRPSASAEMLAEKLAGKPLPVFRKHYRLRPGLWINEPAFFVRQVHQIPIEAFPNAAVVVKREWQDREGRLGEAVLIEVFRQVVRGISKRSGGNPNRHRFTVAGVYRLGWVGAGPS